MMVVSHCQEVAVGLFSIHERHQAKSRNTTQSIVFPVHELTKSSMIFISVNWNPNDTPKRSNLLSFRLRNAQPLILASNII